MNDATLKKIHAELEKVLTGRKFGKIFVLSKLQIAVDFRLDASLYLFISLEPNAPRVYLIERRLKELEKRSGNPPPFLLFLRKRLSNATLRSVEKIAGERILKLDFSAFSEIGQTENYSLIVQLTGRSANLFLLDENGFILDSLRENSGEGQEIADPTRRRKDLKIKRQISPMTKFFRRMIFRRFQKHSTFSIKNSKPKNFFRQKPDPPKRRSDRK